VGSSITGLIVWWLAVPDLAATAELSQRSTEALTHLSTIGTHITQAICEALVLNNLGLDAATSDSQSIVLLGILVGAWLWSRRDVSSAPRRPHWRLNPLEAAGATLVFTNFALIFARRGPQLTYDSLRWLGWFDAIQQLGAVLFAFGWWAGPIESPPPRSVEWPSGRKLLGVAALASLLFLMQAPRANRVIFQYDGAAAEVFAGAAVTGPHNSADLAERARRQRAALAELDTIERTAREGRENRGEFLKSAELEEIPGMPTDLRDFRATDLLDLSLPVSVRAPDQKAQSATSRSDHK